ncbi:PH domain-containing protein [Clostridium sp. UBA4548]|uniref:PH domain-containing protein n=1 Tax=Clostridium sp. UBA4548 TaxID=1946361 RepID=UPI0025C4149E|nr:PH domain-containing protein [Clostridium sp. UBA4548]
MRVFRGIKSFEIVNSVLLAVMYNILLLLLMYNTGSYTVLNLLRALLIACNVFYLYHIFLWATVKYVITEDELQITGIGNLKKVIIPLSDIKGYTIISGKIKGIKLSGIASNRFALGRSVVKTLGTTRMFVTNNTSVIYLRTEEINYAISPKEAEVFEELLNKHNIFKIQWEVKFNKPNKLYKDKKFKKLLFLTSAVIIVMTLNPLVNYLTHRLPNIMPLTFDATFKPITMGTDKQFVSTQMIYGALNAAILFCMYYAAYFCAKYDRKTAYRYLYIALLVSVIFLILQVKIITSAI